MKDLLRRVESDEDDEVAKDLALVLYETSAVRSGFAVSDTSGFFERVEKMLVNICTTVYHLHRFVGLMM